jgi:hypothetical protein
MRCRADTPSASLHHFDHNFEYGPLLRLGAGLAAVGACLAGRGARDLDLDIDANGVLSVVASPRNQNAKGPRWGLFAFLGVSLLGLRLQFPLLRQSASNIVQTEKLSQWRAGPWSPSSWSRWWPRLPTPPSPTKVVRGHAGVAKLSGRLGRLRGAAVHPGARPAPPRQQL